MCRRVVIGPAAGLVISPGVITVNRRFGAVPVAVDGVVSLPLQLLDAPANPESCGNATTPVCTLQDSTSASYSATRIACVVSPGVGTGFQLLIRDVWTALTINGVRAGFRPPQVSAVSPGQLPVVGGNLTIVGEGFGPGPCDGVNRTSNVRLQITAVPNRAGPQPVFDASTGAWGPSGALVSAFVPCAVISWSPSAIVCAAPQGLDASVAVLVSVGGQSVAAQSVGYSPPAVTSVVALQTLGTRGGGVVCVMGTSLPPLEWPLAVLVGGSVCAVDEAAGPRNATMVCCRVPRGAGRAVVVLSTPLQTSESGAGTYVVYAAPEVAEVVTAQGRSVNGGFPVLVRGMVRGRATPLVLDFAAPPIGWAFVCRCCGCFVELSVCFTTVRDTHTPPAACHMLFPAGWNACRTSSQAPSWRS